MGGKGGEAGCFYGAGCVTEKMLGLKTEHTFDCVL